MKLGDLLDVPSLRLRLVTGDPDREVAFVHVTELPDPGPYLDGGELVLTDGLWRSRPRDDERYVHSLANRSAAALGYCPSSSGGAVPATLVEAARHHDMPLVEVPREVPFIAIAKAAATLAVEERERWLLGSLRRAEAMVSSLQRPDGAARLLRRLGQDLGCDCALVDGCGECLAQAGSCGDPSQLARLRPPHRAGAHPARLAGADVTVLDVAEPGSAGGLLVLARAPAELSDGERLIASQAVAYLGLELARRAADRRASEWIETRRMSELLDGRAQPDAVRAWLDAVAIASHEPAVAIWLAPGEATDGERALAVVRRQGRAWGRGFLAACVADGIGVLAPVHGSTDERALAAEAQAAAAACCGAVAAGFAGVAAQDPVALRAAFVKAQAAARRGAQAPGRAGLVAATAVASHELLLALQDLSTRAALVADLLGPLIAYDARRRTDLLQTLRLLLESGGWKATAADLHIHVNTLRERAGRIERLTGRDLGRMADRVDLFLALRALREGESGAGALA